MSHIFQSKRLITRTLNLEDEELFFKMMSDSRVMDPVPQPVFNRKESHDKLLTLITAEPHGKKMIWAITELDNPNLIGICGFLKNSDGNPELAYRFMPQFWGKGYGSEIAHSLLEYGFNKLDYKIIDADVSTKNSKSINILNKHMRHVRDFWNENDQGYDKRYRLLIKEFN